MLGRCLAHNVWLIFSRVAASDHFLVCASSKSCILPVQGLPQSAMPIVLSNPDLQAWFSMGPQTGGAGHKLHVRHRGLQPHPWHQPWVL